MNTHRQMNELKSKLEITQLKYSGRKWDVLHIQWT